MATNGSFYWNELMTRDAEAAKKFYGATLGWTFEAMEQSDGPAYWVAKVGEESVAGILQMEGPDYADPNYYAVFFEDPSGNRFEICHRTQAAIPI